MTGEHEDTLRMFQARLTEVALAEYVLTLFVSGASDISARAIANCRDICERYFAGRYRLQVIDIHRDPTSMSAHNVLAAPTLLRHEPLPVRRLVGDLSDTERVLAALGYSGRQMIPSAPAESIQQWSDLE